MNLMGVFISTTERLSPQRGITRVSCDSNIRRLCLENCKRPSNTYRPIGIGKSIRQDITFEKEEHHLHPSGAPVRSVGLLNRPAATERCAMRVRHAHPIRPAHDA